jgi:beta-galactosidase GanA
MTAGFAVAQGSGDNALPRIVEQNGRHALLVDGAPYLMVGAQVNNSSAWPEMLPEVWPTVERLGINTLEAPIYWEQMEPERGHFDMSMVHTLLDQAREHHVHLVLLWFGTYKNGSGHYIPEYLKTDEKAAPHVINSKGRKVDSLAPYSETLLDADRTAFAHLMRELKAADPQHTVLMVQVENETGTYGSIRDFSPKADKLFQSAVPERVLKALHKPAGTWPQVFGADADAFFYAWSIADFVNKVAEAGKAEYPLPMYVNAALRDPIHPGPAGTYDNGGPTDDVLPIWKAAAPAIDLVAPDIYLSDYARYMKVLELYARPDNALLVPETGSAAAYARYFFAALGHGAIGFSPFGMDATGYTNEPLGAPSINERALAPFMVVNHLFEPMQREIAKLNFEGMLQAVSEDPDIHTQTLSFPKWTATVSYGLPRFGNGRTPVGNTPAQGGAMVAQLGPNEFLVTAIHARIDFAPADGAEQRQFLRVEEGTYDKGTWHPIRIWNGDQTDYGLNFTSAAQVLRVTLATY